MRVLEPGESRRKSFSSSIRAISGSPKYVVNIMLACFAVALETYYSYCGGSCSYLKGNLIGIPLQYIGIGYMACIVLMSLLRANTLLLMPLSTGVGIEIYLVGFQMWHHTYCPYCLAFGAVVFILFLLNLSRAGKWLSLILMALALILFSRSSSTLAPSVPADRMGFHAPPENEVAFKKTVTGEYDGN